MTGLQKQALLKLVICAFVLIALTVFFFSRGGANTFVQDITRKILVAVFLGAGYVSIIIAQFMTRKKPGSKRVLIDERDERIARLANGTAFTVLGVYIFLTCIILYEVYHNSEVMPVGWMWFLAYSSSFLSIMSHAVTTLFLYTRMGGHG